MKNSYKFFAFFKVIMVSAIMLTSLNAAAISTSAFEATLSIIDVQPAAPGKIFVGQTLQFKAVGTYSDGSIADITSQATWTISDTTVAGISDSGLVNVAVPQDTHGSAVVDSSGVDVSITANMSDVISSPVTLTVFTVDGPSAYYQYGGNVRNSNQNIIASDNNQSGIKVTDAGILALSDTIITTSGDTSVIGLASSSGLNSAVLAQNGAKIKISNCMITTAGIGANGAFAHGEGSLVELYNVKIRCTNEAAHGVDATYLGSIILEDADIYTAGQGASAALSNDTGDGSITATRVKAYTEGRRSPGFYAIGSMSVFTITDSDLFAKTGEGGLLTTGAIVTLKNSTVTGSTAGVSCSGGTLTITGGSVTGTAGPAFLVVAGPGRGIMAQAAQGGQQAGGPPGGGAPGGGMADGPPGGARGSGMAGGFEMASIDTDIIVKGGVKINGSNGDIINVTEESKATLTADGEELIGNILVEESSTLHVTLLNSILTGKIQGAAIDIGPGSSWNVTGDSTLTILSNKDGISGSTITNIIGNGHTVYYDPNVSANSWLKGRTYSLTERGRLVPKK